MSIESITKKVSEFCALNCLAYKASLYDTETAMITLLKDDFEVSTLISMLAINSCTCDLLEFRLQDCLDLLKKKAELAK